MPDQRVHYGGPTVFAGRFREDDTHTQFRATTVHDAVHVDDGAIQLDANNVDGTIIVTHELGVQDILRAKQKGTGDTTVLLGRNGKITCHNMEAINVSRFLGGVHIGENDDGDAHTTLFPNGEVRCLALTADTVTGTSVEDCSFISGSAFSATDDHTVEALPTVVQRDPETGIVQIANLRCLARKVGLDENGLASDGVQPGLFVTEGTVSEELKLIQDAKIVYTPDDNRFYRFGCSGAQTNVNMDGLHFSDGIADQLNSVNLRVSRSEPTLTLTGTKADNVNVISVQDPTGSPVFGVSDTGTVDCPLLLTGEIIVTRPLASDPSQNEQLFVVDGEDISCKNVDMDILDCKTIAATGDLCTFKNINTDNIDADDIECVKLTASGDVEAPYLELQPAAVTGARQTLIRGYNAGGLPVFTLYDDGELKFKHNFDDQSKPATVASSILVEDDSLYVGSARMSYDRVGHVMTLHRLKQGHIPDYLDGRGFVAADLPSGYTHDDMSVQDWLLHARDHFSEEDLDVKHVFPSSNTDDWVLIDAPTPALQSDVVTLQTFATGADADITTLETEMDQAQTDITALQSQGGGLSSQETISSADGTASLTIKSSQAADVVNRVGLSFWLDRDDSNEQEFAFRNGGGTGLKDLIVTATQAFNTGNAVERESMRFLATGHVMIVGGETTGNAYGGYGASGRGFRCIPSAHFFGQTDFLAGVSFGGG